MSHKKKHHREGQESVPEPNPNPEADAGALWSEVPAAAGEAAVVEASPPTEAGEAPPAGPPPELETLKAQAAEYLDGWQRSRAEFANYKKRIEREQEEARARVTGEVLLHFVNVLDDLERALRDRPEGGEAASWASGIELIYRKLLAVLEAEGVRTILPDGGMFDPNFHEAVTHEQIEGHAEGEIIAVVHQGYQIGDRVLRPALVRVAK